MSYDMTPAQLARFRKVSSFATSKAPTFSCDGCGQHKLLEGSTGNRKTGKFCKTCSIERKAKEASNERT